MRSQTNRKTLIENGKLSLQSNATFGTFPVHKCTNDRKTTMSLNRVMPFKSFNNKAQAKK